VKGKNWVLKYMIIPSIFFFHNVIYIKTSQLVLCVYIAVCDFYFICQWRKIDICVTQKIIKIISKENHFNILLHFVFYTEEMTDGGMVF